MSYEKHRQLRVERPLYRDHERFWQVLSVKKPKTREESEAQRYGKCACPGCAAVGTRAKPLDLHHIVPRSHSKELIDEFTNHVYLCGDFFEKNHHKALHHERTSGWKDWKQLNVFEKGG